MKVVVDFPFIFDLVFLFFIGNKIMEFFPLQFISRYMYRHSILSSSLLTNIVVIHTSTYTSLGCLQESDIDLHSAGLQNQVNIRIWGLLGRPHSKTRCCLLDPHSVSSSIRLFPIYYYELQDKILCEHIYRDLFRINH